MTDRDVHLPVAAQPTIDSIVDYLNRRERRVQLRLAPRDVGTRRRHRPDGDGRAHRLDRRRLEHSQHLLADAGHAGPDGGDATGGLRGPIPAGTRSERPRRDRELARCGVRESPQANPRDGRDRPSGALGETVDYDGDDFDLSGFRLRCDPPETPPPIEVTGMGPKAVELAGRFADGWHGIMLTPRNERPTRGHRARC